MSGGGTHDPAGPAAPAGAEVRRSVRVPNPAGLHARPCHAIATLAGRYRSALEVSCSDARADGRSVLSLMTLCAPCESTLTLSARGEDAAELVDAVAALIEDGFGEMR